MSIESSIRDSAEHFAEGVASPFHDLYDGTRQLGGAKIDTAPTAESDGFTTAGHMLGSAALYIGSAVIASRIPMIGRLAPSLVGGGLGFLQPVGANEGMWTRMADAGIGVASVAGLQYGPGALARLGIESQLGRVVATNAGIGMVNANLDSLLHTGQFASFDQTVSNGAIWGATGAAFHAVGLGIHSDTPTKVEPPKQPLFGESTPGQTTLGQQSTVVFNDGREYEIFAPKGYDPAKASKLMLIMHGDGFTRDGAGLMAKETGMNALADDQNFLVAYPRAMPRMIDKGILKGRVLGDSWNVPGARNITTTWDNYNDVHYLDRVIGDVSQRFNVDPNYISMAGFSDGGRMAQRYALERPGRVAAIASIHGTILGDEQKLSSAAVKPAVMIVHSTPGRLPWQKDMIVPWEGGLGFVSGAKPWGGLFDGLKDSSPQGQLGLWTDNPDAPAFTRTLGNLSHTVINDGGRKIYQLLIGGGQHAWDGTHGTGGLPGIGMRLEKPEITPTVARFLLKHSLPDGSLDIQRSIA